MGKRFLILTAILGLVGSGVWFAANEAFAQDGGSRTAVFQSKVDLVVLSFTVTDNKGKYVNGLKPADFRIMEDGIKEKLATFSEGNRPAVQILDDGTTKPMAPGEQPEGERLVVNPAPTAAGDAFVGTNVFVLFDTSNFMYHGFVSAEEALAGFVRG